MFDYLHAYWRGEYAESPQDAQGQRENPFLEIPKNNDEKKTHLIFRSEYCYCVMNKYPYSIGHLLIVPYRQVPDICDLTKEEKVDFFDSVCRAESILKQAISPHGFNIGISQGPSSGAGIPQHLHCHVVPRWNGDTNFMTVVFDTRVFSFSMDSVWERLRKFM